MRIGSQGMDTNIQTNSLQVSSNTKNTVKADASMSSAVDEHLQKALENKADAQSEGKDGLSKEKVQEAVKSINKFLEIQHKASRFQFHEGLDKYYVQLIDADTEEVIKEIPPKKLLDAFYEMQKLAGVIVDEKV